MQKVMAYPWEQCDLLDEKFNVAQFFDYLMSVQAAVKNATLYSNARVELRADATAFLVPLAFSDCSL